MVPQTCGDQETQDLLALDRDQEMAAGLGWQLGEEGFGQLGRLRGLAPEGRLELLLLLALGLDDGDDRVDVHAVARRTSMLAYDALRRSGT